MYHYMTGLLNHISKEIGHTKEMGHEDHNLKVKEAKTRDPTHIKAQMDPRETKTTPQILEGLDLQGSNNKMGETKQAGRDPAK